MFLPVCITHTMESFLELWFKISFFLLKIQLLLVPLSQPCEKWPHSLHAYLPMGTVPLSCLVCRSSEHRLMPLEFAKGAQSVLVGCLR